MVGERRFVIRAHVIGAVIKDKQEKKMFMISVLWSDAAEVIVYRSYHDFKAFHTALKNRFPQRNFFQKKTRQIPKLKGKASMLRLQQLVSNEPAGHMKFLEKFCEELLKCDPAVTQSFEATQFFTPKDHDLDSDYTKNSAMILISDSGDGGDHLTHQHADVITQPFVTQTYSCVAAYETKDMKNRPFNVAEDEKLDVLIKDPAGWWLVEKDDKRLAWFPAPYLVLWEPKEYDNDGPQQGGGLYCAIRNYTAKDDDEVSVPIGSPVEVLTKSDNGWWFIRFNGKGGYIPSLYLQPYNNPRASLHSLQRKVHSSTLNMAVSFDSAYTANLNKSRGPLRSVRQARRGLQKAHSLDILSEDQHVERDVPLSKPRYTRTMTNTSSDSNFSVIYSSSESVTVPSKEGRRLRRQANVSESRSNFSSFDRSNSSQSSERSASRSSGGSETASAVLSPVIPCRPRPEEILCRCSSITRKAALGSTTRV